MIYVQCQRSEPMQEVVFPLFGSVDKNGACLIFKQKMVAHIPSIKLISIVFFIELENLCENDWKKNGQKQSSRSQTNIASTESKAPFVKHSLSKPRIIHIIHPHKTGFLQICSLKNEPKITQGMQFG